MCSIILWLGLSLLVSQFPWAVTFTILSFLLPYGETGRLEALDLGMFLPSCWLDSGKVVSLEREIRMLLAYFKCLDFSSLIESMRGFSQISSYKNVVGLLEIKLIKVLSSLRLDPTEFLVIKLVYP